MRFIDGSSNELCKWIEIESVPGYLWTISWNTMAVETFLDRSQTDKVNNQKILSWGILFWRYTVNAAHDRYWWTRSWDSAEWNTRIQNKIFSFWHIFPSLSFLVPNDYLLFRNLFSHTRFSAVCNRKHLVRCTHVHTTWGYCMRHFFPDKL